MMALLDTTINLMTKYRYKNLFGNKKKRTSHPQTLTSKNIASIREKSWFNLLFIKSASTKTRKSFLHLIDTSH